MATPDIGTTISDGYSRGLDRLGAWAPPLAVIGLVAGSIAAALATLQAQVAPDAADVLRSVFSGDTDVDLGDYRTFTIIGAIGTAIQLVLTFGAYTLFSGVAHRARHGAPEAAPDAGGAIPRLLAAVASIAPKVWIIAGAMLVAQVLGAFPPIGPLLGMVVYVWLIIMFVRWTYAWVIAGSGEASGNAAFAASERAVAGSWWPTLGVWFVIGLATLLPVAIAAMIAGAIVPTTFGSTLAATVVQFVLGVPIFASALDSGWAQIEERHGTEAPARGDRHGDPERPSDAGGPFV